MGDEDAINMLGEQLLRDMWRGVAVRICSVIRCCPFAFSLRSHTHARAACPPPPLPSHTAELRGGRIVLCWKRRAVGEGAG